MPARIEALWPGGCLAAALAMTGPTVAAGGTEWLQAMQGRDLQFSAASVEYRGVQYDHVEAQVQVQPQALVTARGSAGVGADGALRFNARLRPRHGEWHWDGEVHAERLDPGALPGLQPLLRGGTVSLHAELASAGADPAALLAGLSGRIGFHGGGSQLLDAGLDRVGDDLLLQLIGVVNPFARGSQASELRCAAGLGRLEAGSLVFERSLALETDRVLVAGGGRVHLPDGSLALRVAPTARHGVTFSAGTLARLVEVGGTLAEPDIRPLAEGLLREGLGLGTALATGGLRRLAGVVLDEDNAGACAPVLAMFPAGWRN